jgi:hypothetical protein
MAGQVVDEGSSDNGWTPSGRQRHRVPPMLLARADEVIE